MLTLSDLKTDLYQLVGVNSNTTRTDITTAVRGAIRRGQEFFVNYADWGFLHQLQDVVYYPLAAPYETGTVTVTQDSKAVTGSGTTFTKDMEGSFLLLGETESYEIQSYTSATAITLAIPYQGTTASAQTFFIYKRFYPLPLDFVRPLAEQCKIQTPGSNAENALSYRGDASFADRLETGKPQWFGLQGNSRRADYYNTGTVTIATTTGVSTWTVSAGTLPTDIVDREVRIVGESRAYRIATRGGATTFTTYQTYYNPSDATNAVSAASYAITPKDTKLIGFSHIADQRYIFGLPYIRYLDELIASTDISPIVQAGYEHAFLSVCRMILAYDGRTAMRGDTVAKLKEQAMDAMALAWSSEQHGETMKRQAATYQPDRIQVGPSWIG